MKKDNKFTDKAEELASYVTEDLRQIIHSSLGIYVTFALGLGASKKSLKETIQSVFDLECKRLEETLKDKE